MWGRRRNGLTDNFTLAVDIQFLVAADSQPVVLHIDTLPHGRGGRLPSGVSA